jgi:outer membrane protein assembly factor BamB
MNHRKLLVAALLAASALLGMAVASQAPAASVAISPFPGTPSAMPKTQVSFLGASARALSGITVVGSSSGRHRGRLRSYASATGASFIPSKAFTPGERVTVRARWAFARGKSRKVSTFFTIAQPSEIPQNGFPSTPGTPADVQSFVSAPALHPPVVTVNHPPSAGSAPGLLLAGPFKGPGQYGPMIFDNGGNLVWFRPLAGGLDATDLRTQTYRGKPVLTWWQGRTVSFGYGLGEGVIADTRYRTVARVKTGNGLPADEHEFKLTPSGSAYLLAYSPVQMSLASAGGPTSGVALDGVIQQIDIRTGLVMWEWHSLGNVDLTESFSKPPTSSGGVYDYFHINSVVTDSRGNFLISARNTSAVYQINARSGKLEWTLGGKHSSFTLGPGVVFAFQHNALWVAPDKVSIYDDEGAPPVKPPSRGEIIAIDTKAHTATLATQYVRTPPLITLCCGNTQPLPGGGAMVGWGGLPNLTEFNARGEIVFDAQFPAGEFNYRVYREPWEAQPSEPPALALRTTGSTRSAYVSWNGATHVASWQLLAGPSAAHLSPVSTTPRSGFETVIPAPATGVVRVHALSASGKVLATTKAISQ